MTKVLVLFLAGLIMNNCSKADYPVINSGTTAISLTTDKASYNPGEEVNFTLSKSIDNLYIRYKYLSEIIEENAVNTTTWTWTAPSVDYKGYMAELYVKDGTNEEIKATVGIDVSSDWNKFPRYGFLSDYGEMTDDEIDAVILNLNKYHINGLQFYDWHYKHHEPLAGTGYNPEEVWTEIANRSVYLSTVKKYIEKAHGKNMNAMFYNLAYGALDDAAEDGVSDTWYIYNDQNHSEKEVLKLASPMFKSYIYLLDPGNPSWQAYLNAQNAEVYMALDFDGFHIDQLGDWGTVYNYNGDIVLLPEGYQSFINSNEAAAPAKKMIMNAVNQFGQENIAQTHVDFLYTEVWSPNVGFADLVQVIKNNNAYSNNSKSTVLAAYMNYNLADNAGTFNTPAILFADAVIFAFGGSHLELGEHMLCKEYFPNDNLEMAPPLKTSLVKYYDFMVAYQNLLRDGGTFNEPAIVSTDGKTSLEQWPPSTGNVSVVGKTFDNKQVVHLINFANAAHFDWRDNSGNQNYPTTFYNCTYSFTYERTVARIWFASPDYYGGVSQDLDFTNSGTKISFTIPTLEYWSMLVFEYE
jgi:dextranase